METEASVAVPPYEQSTEAESAADKPKPRRSRIARRHVAKSEPASRLQDSVDGAQDSDVTAVSSGESQPLLQGPPAVSILRKCPVHLTDTFIATTSGFSS